jgi:hypothetical protein
MKRQTSFEVATPVCGESVINGRLTTTHYGDLLITGMGYYIDGGYDCDIESIEWVVNGEKQSNIIDLSVQISDTYSYCLDVAKIYLRKNWQPFAEELEYEMMHREINMAEYANSIFKSLI